VGNGSLGVAIPFVGASVKIPEGINKVGEEPLGLSSWGYNQPEIPTLIFAGSKANSLATWGLISNVPEIKILWSNKKATTKASSKAVIMETLLFLLTPDTNIFSGHY
jgi:hypothetical protein